MDFATITNNVNSIIKTSGKEGGTTDAYKDIPSVDAQREIIVSHMKSEYNDKTLKMLNAKAFADTANTYKNLKTSTEGEIEKLRSHASELETKIHTREDDLKNSSSKSLVLQILLMTLASVIGVYYTMRGFEYVHAIALGCILIGFGYSQYVQAHPGTTAADIFNSVGNFLSAKASIPTLPNE